MLMRALGVKRVMSSMLLLPKKKADSWKNFAGDQKKTY